MLAENSYGKSGIRLVKLARLPDRHELRDITVAVKLEGDFAAAHVSGDNAAILPTDTMKNTVYALAKDRFDGAIESFALTLAEHFLERLPEISRVSIEIVEHGWERLNVRGAPHPHAFIRPGAESRLCSVRRDRQEEAVESGIEGLTVLKSADSAFAGFFKDEYTTLPETADRIFATAIRAVWTYLPTDVSFDKTWLSVRQTLLETFAGHESASVQTHSPRDGGGGGGATSRDLPREPLVAQQASPSGGPFSFRPREQERDLRRHGGAVRIDRGHGRARLNTQDTGFIKNPIWGLAKEFDICQNI